MCIDANRHKRVHQTGLTLIEAVIFIVIISVGVAGLLGVMNVTTKYSADPMIRKQAIAIAESLLEEIQLQPFTYCLPTDDKALTATSTAGCTGGVAGSEDTLPTSARVSNIAARDANNVADYNTFAMSPILDVIGDPAPGLGGYSANVAISQVGANFTNISTGSVLPAGDVLQINVTVTPPNGEAITLTGYRFRYAPRAVP